MLPPYHLERSCLGASSCISSPVSGDFNIPRSLTLYTPVVLELALRCPFASLSGGEDDKPETAESTLLRGAVSADILVVLNETTS